MSSRTVSLAALLATTALLAVLAAPASAATGPKLRVFSVANTTVAPGGTLQYLLEVKNAGDADTLAPADPSCDPNSPPLDPNCVLLTAALPAGVTGVGVSGLAPGFNNAHCTGFGVPGPTTVTCGLTESAVPFQSVLGAPGGVGGFVTGVLPILTVSVDPSAAGLLRSEFTVSGGGSPASATVDPTAVAATPPPFGIASFDGQVADAAANPYTQAAGHPYVASTSIEFNTAQNPHPLKGAAWPIEPIKDVVVDLPPGLVGNPTSLDRCAASDLARPGAIPFCPPASQVGNVRVFVNGLTQFANAWGPIPIYNMAPPPGVPARFGFNFAGNVVTLDAKLRSASDYGLSVQGKYTSEGLAVAGVSVSFWGVPAATDHDPERACAGIEPPWQQGKFCPAGVEPKPILRLPTSCSEPEVGLTTRVHVDSWFNPARFDAEGAPELGDPSWRSASFDSHRPPGYPAPAAEWGDRVGPENCAGVPFEPRISLTPTTKAADSPTGLSVDLSVPQECWEEENAVCQADLRDAEVTLPRGMTVNPASANGLGACGSEQIGLTTPIGTTPIHFSAAAGNCPASSKLGTVAIQTPLLDHTVSGEVFLAKQADNPFGSLLALYILAEDPVSGVVLKLAGRVEARKDGQLVTTFADQPQLPFEHLHLELFGGPRAALRTPATCGSHTSAATLDPWSGNAPVHLTSSFQIVSGPNGGPCPNGAFNPKLSAGTENPLAGTYSPFFLRLTREDGTPELTGLSLSPPQGLIGKPAGIPYCPDAALDSIPTGDASLGKGAAQLASPACPAASRLGTVTAGAGAGTNPFYVSSGRAYLAGPYKGAPLSLAVVTPALAGPFDLGNVVVRSALRVDPETAQITAVSDPLPTTLQGIALDLRDVRVNLDRPSFTLNPTSCDPMAVSGTIGGSGGASAKVSDRFQVGGCDRLGFRPKLSLRLKGGTRRGAHPALTAILVARKGDANIGRASVALPHSEFLAQSHIRTICTRVQFAAGQCPPGSIYGKATATSPLLDYPLTGNVYLRSSTHPLPDMVLALHGPASQPIEVDAVGRIDSVSGGIRATFETLPDAPLTKVVLRMKGGKRGLLENSRDICRSTNRATAQFDGQNGKVADSRPVLEADCGEKKGKRRRG